MPDVPLIEWLDFSRGVASERNRQALAKHLADGCPRCERIVTLLLQMVDVAGRECHYQVPPSLLKAAKAVRRRPESRPEKSSGLLCRLVPRLLSDSLGDPLPAGVRCHERVTRQALFQAGSFYLDLCFAQESATPEVMVMLVGQIADAQVSAQPLSGVPVELIHGEAILADTRSNWFGEFELAYRPREELTLLVRVSPSTEIELSLDQLKTQPGGVLDCLRNRWN